MPPNVLVIMTDEERYPPPYEDEATRRFRADQLPARQRLRARSLELHRHYAAATACAPSRTSLFTGQYPSLHGVRSTDGIAKTASDPDISWLDPDQVPTMGDWFRAAGYQTHYRGKWHISHADLPVPGTHQNLATNDPSGGLVDDAVAAYRATDRLGPFGFAGWIGREPHGPDPADSGFVKDGLYGEQVADLFGQLEHGGDDRPWLAVASFVNPHDIAFTGGIWEAFGFPPPDDTVPDVSEAPSQADPFDGRPRAQRQFFETWPKALFPQPTDLAYRRLYYWLHKLVDRVVERILDALERSPFARDTLVVFTSDHGDLLGAHGGLLQKWHNAFDEATRVPFLVSGPGIEPGGPGITVPTSHVDLLPTLLGLAGLQPGQLVGTVATHHVETHPLVGRDLSPSLSGREGPAAPEGPIYFMTEDHITRGSRQIGLASGEPYEAVMDPASVESVITELPTGTGGGTELWKLNHYYDRPEPTEEDWEAYNLTADPEERRNLGTADEAPLSRLRAALDAERRAKRLTPRHR
ncbi:MAG TPA: sulfatase-like hydrolase/transferase [Acidimicrobiales bacterium]|jgi:arylsulfatase A-like enzyme|nr:sulfatase-like hydrolase/transferase [Acidimicrobiales bacterium]